MVRIRTTAALLVLALPAVCCAQDFEKATLRVLVPVPDAKLEIQGKLTTRTGTTRTFDSPLLAPGRGYLYDLKATWVEDGKTITRQKTARVMAGQTVEVDMSVVDKAFAAEPPAKTPGTVKSPPEVKPDVPFVATPEEIVDEMLKMASVTENDVVYDLGCGDGRIVIAAVKKFKAKKGVGIDIDPARVKESDENAKKEGVVEKVEFKVGDVLKLTDKDLADATVVTLYLSPKVNNQLAPLLKSLKPGTRIVSHDFGITNWPEQDKKDVVDKKNLDNSIYLWTVK